MRPFSSRAVRRAAILAIWAISGLAFASRADSVLFWVFLFLWPWNLIVLAVWGISGLLATLDGLVEAGRRRSWRRGLVFGLFPILICAGMMAVGHAAMSHPTDEAMIREFRSHRAEYEDLLAIYRADRQLGRIGPGFTRPANFFSGGSLPPGDPPTASQLADIRARCRRLHLEAGIEGYEDKSVVDFIRSSRGLSISGSSKGFVWSVERPPVIVANTDRYSRPDGRSYIAYRHIDGDWYVYYDYED